MTTYLEKISINSSYEGMHDITAEVQEIVKNKKCPGAPYRAPGQPK